MLGEVIVVPGPLRTAVAVVLLLLGGGGALYAYKTWDNDSDKRPLRELRVEALVAGKTAGSQAKESNCRRGIQTGRPRSISKYRILQYDKRVPFAVAKAGEKQRPELHTILDILYVDSTRPVTS